MSCCISLCMSKYFFYYYSKFICFWFVTCCQWCMMHVLMIHFWRYLVIIESIASFVPGWWCWRVWCSISLSYFLMRRVFMLLSNIHVGGTYIVYRGCWWLSWYCDLIVEVLVLVTYVIFVAWCKCLVKTHDVVIVIFSHVWVFRIELSFVCNPIILGK